MMLPDTADPHDLSLPILYQDEHLVAVHKPSGLLVHRSPIDRQYERLLFKDVYPGMGYIPLRHANNMPHRVMAFHVESAQERWADAKHPLLDFMCHTHHPDIELGENVTPNIPVWQSLRQRTVHCA